MRGLLTLIILSFVLPIYSVSAQEQPTAVIGTVVTASSANVRSEASSTSAIVDRIAEGVEMDILESIPDGEAFNANPQWYRVRLESGIEGYIWSGVLSDIRYAPECAALQSSESTAGRIILGIDASTSNDTPRLLYVMTPDGLNFHRVTDNDPLDTAYEMDATWSQDGSIFAYTWGNDAPGYYSTNIVITDPEFLSPQVLAIRLPGGTVSGPSGPNFSPDSYQFAATGMALGGIKSLREPINTGLILIDLSRPSESNRGLEIFGHTVLLDTERDEGAPVWSPDGRRIAYLAVDDMASTGNLWMVNVLDLDTGETLELSAGLYPQWSPDGEELMYVSYQDAPGDIIVANMNSGTIETLVEGTPETPDFYLVDAKWSPDGKAISYVYYPDGIGGLYVMEPDGSESVRLTPPDSGYHILNIAWSPDGRQLAFLTQIERNGRYSHELYRIDADGSNFCLIHTGNGSAYDLLWSR